MVIQLSRTKNQTPNPYFYNGTEYISNFKKQNISSKLK